MSLQELKREAYEANLLLVEHRLIPLTFGNASAVDRGQGIFAIKPSGVPYAKLKPQDMVLVDLEGRKVEGSLNPSSDTPTHLRIYQGFAPAGGVVHTHSRFATAFAQSGRPVPCLGTTHADYFRGEIPVTRKMTQEEIAGQYEWETGNVILERFRDLDAAQCPGVLVRSHGPFSWGATGAAAAENSVAMEFLAETAYYSLHLNPAAAPIDAALHDRHFLRKHGKGAYYGQGKAAAEPAPLEVGARK